MKNIALKERLEAIMDKEQLNAKQFHRKTGIPYPTIINYIHERRTRIDSDIAEKILDTFPYLNPHYVYAGKEPMLFPEKDYIKYMEKKIKELEDKLEMAQKYIAARDEIIMLKNEIENGRAEKETKKKKVKTQKSAI